jgi:hypothetical protein
MALFGREQSTGMVSAIDQRSPVFRARIAPTESSFDQGLID